MTEHETPIPDDLATIGASELGKLLGRSTKSIKIDATRRPNTLPQRFVVPGSRKVRWRVVDVRAWMQALADLEAERRHAAAEVMRRAGMIDTTMVSSFHLGQRDRGAAATERLEEKKGEH